MSVASVLRTELTGNAGVAALVSTRVYPVLLPQKPTYPALVYQRVSNTPQMGTTAVRVSRWQIDCWDDDYSGVQTLAAAVKAALEECSGTGIKMGIVVNELDDYDADVDAYRVIVDVMLTTTGD